MAKSDDILKKYGITQVKGSENNTGSTATSSNSQKTKNTDNSKADSILAKYGITQVRQSKYTSAQEWAEASKSLVSEIQQHYGSWNKQDDEKYNSIQSRLYSYLSQGDAFRQQYDGDDEATTSINSIVAALNNADSYASHNRDYFSQWDSQEAYDEYLAYQKDYDEKKSYDVDAAQKEIEELEKRKAQLLNESRKPSQPYAAGSKYVESAPYAAGQQAATVDAGSKEIRELEKQISQKKQYLNQAKYIQKGVTLSSVAESDDFKEYSGYVSTYDDSGWARLLGKEYDDAYEYINNQNGFRDEYKSEHRAYSSDNPWSDGESSFEEKGYDYMNQSEIAIYNYHYAKEGKEKAQEYLDSIQETLNQRKAGIMFQEMEGNTALEMVFGVEAGLDQFKSGIHNVFNTEDDYIAQSAYQMASAMVREDLADDSIPLWYNFKTGKWEDKILGHSAGQIGYDAITTTANMVPSIMTSMAIGMVNPVAGQVIGTGLMGASASGNAYQEMLNMGYDKSQARAYSILVGASEAGLQYLLGGIGSMGGKLSGDVITKMMNGVDNAFLRTALKLAGNMASEGFEEGLQEILTPWFQNLIMHTDENIDWSEVAYSTLLGALTAGIMEGGNTITGEVNTYKTGKQLQAADISAKRLAELGQTFAADTVAYQLASRVDENTGAYTIGRLFNEIGATMTEQNVNEITEALVGKGMTEDVARANAKALAVVVDGGNLTDLQVSIIESNEVLAEAVRTTLIDSNATWFQRTKGYNDALMALAQEKTSPKAARTEQSAPGQENAAVSDKVDTQNENGSEADTSPAKARSIASIQNKQATITMEDGSQVSVKDADIDPSDSVLIETIAGIDGISVEDANFLYNTLKAAPGAIAQVSALGAKEVYRYGYYGMTDDHIDKHGVFAGSLTKSQRDAIYNAGKEAGAKRTADKQAAVAKNATADHSADAGKKGKVHFDGNINNLNRVRKTSIAAMEKIADTLGIQIYVFESFLKDGSRVYIDKNGVVKPAPNGWYEPGNGSIHIDLNAGGTGEGVMLFTLAHELTHHIRKWSPEKFKVLSDFLMEEYGKSGKNVDALVRAQQDKAWRTRKAKLSYDAAWEEVVADSMQAMLSDGNVMTRLEKLKAKDKDLWHEVKEFVNKFAAKIRKAYKEFTPDSDESMYVAEMGKAVYKLQELFADALVDATENYQSMMTMEENTDTVAVEELTQYSYRSLAEAAGFEAVENEDGTRSFMRGGVKVSKVTVDDIEHSPIGAFINYSLAKNDISDKEAKRQKKMFAEICTMACKTNDFAMTMQFVGSAVFTGMKANADKQYGTTYDFPSICTKTQAVIDAMSKRMVSLGRGLSSDELVKLYQDVFTSGNPVPCPECYVFSRWIGIGGLLDNIKKYQDYYGDMKVEDVAKAYRTMRDEVAAFAEEQGISFGKAKGALTSKLTKEYNKLTEKIEKAQNQGEKVKPADQKRLDELEPMMNTVKGMTWLENVYFADSSLKKVNPRFRVPNEVLFDLNNGEAFATQYKEAWAFRTTQGAGYGKAITPYAEARLGEGVLVTNNTTNAIKGKAQGSLDNFFLRQNGTMDKKAREALDRARVKQKIQAFIGGQRFQSTSDARYENASDYLLAALEMQAMHGMVQVYTKVDGAVPAFSAWGFSINQSLMPLGGGLDERGNVKDTSVGGMNRDIAFRNREKHETAGTITIGVNDNHIRAMFKQWVRDFIIPYHASGGKADVVAAFRSIQEGQEKRGQMVRSTDYSRTQGDKVLSDEVLRWQGKTEAQIQRIHEVRAARIAILTGGKVDMTVVRSNRFLTALHDKIYNGEWKGVKLAKSKVESQIFPNEFWDQSVSYEDSGKVTRDYLEYCEDLGFLHRFSGMVPSNGKLVPVKGYDQNGNKVQLTDLAYKYDENGQKTDQIEEYFWKVLTDRRMYDNQGKYLPQKVVTLNDTTEDTVTGFAKGNYGRQYDKALSMKTAEEIAGKMYSDRDSLTPDQQKHFDYNQKQSTVGSTLKTLKGSAIKRSAKYGVGKEIGGEIYFHKDYAEDIVPSEVLSQAEHLLEENHSGFEYNCLKYNPKTGVVAFQEAPDFDSAREPVVGDYVSVNTNTGAVKTGHSNYIWHHKWNWVKNDYSGFDVEESWNWSKQWLSTLTEVSDGNGIERWNTQLDKFGLPKDGESDAYEIKYQLREVEPVKPTSANWQPAHKESWFAENGFPLYRNVSEEQRTANEQYEMDKRSGGHGTQNKSTLPTYDKIFKFIMARGDSPRILDASAGLGAGTELGKEYGLDIHDIEPFPNANYKPEWTDYDGLQKLVESGKEKPFDLIISNAVLNVLAQDSRDNLVAAMDSLLAPGGQMFINVIGKDYDGAKKATPEIKRNSKGVPIGTVLTQEGENDAGREVFVWQSNSVQKVFSPQELKSYLQDALGEGYIIDTPAKAWKGSKLSGTMVVITKPDDSSNLNAEVKYSIRDIVGPSGKNYGTGVYLDSTLLDNLSEDERIAMVKEYIKEIGGSTFTAYDNNHKAIDILLVESSRKFKNKSGKNVPVLKDMTNYLKSDVKQEAIALIDELILASTYKGPEPATHPHDWVDNNGANDWDVWTTYIQDKKNTVWEAKLRIANSTNGEKILYDIFPINKVEEAQTMGAATTNGIVSQPGTGVNMFSDRDTESVSNRSLLANAFEGVAQDEFERNKIREYKDKIDLINAEERKLAELNQKIRDLSFAKGPKDTKAIKDLQFEARQTANRINTYDSQLLRLEASKPLQKVLAREKQKAYQRAEKKGKEALEAYRERAAKTQRELLDRYQESRKKAMESREKTAMRHKIRGVVNDLNQYLLHGTKDRHVPESLQKAVAEALNAVNMDTVGAEERIAKLEAELMKAKTPEQIQEISRKIDHIREMGDKMSGRLKKLKDAYDDLLKSPDENTRNSYDEVIHNKLDAVVDKIGDTALRDMTLEQLEDVYDMYRMVLKTIRDVNKSFKDAKKESISTRANAVMAQVEEVGGKHKLSPTILNGIKKFGWNNLKPVYAFEHIGSVTLTTAFNNVRAGEDVWAKDVTEAREFYLEKSKKYKYDTWDFQKQYRFQSTSEMDFSLNLEQILSLYAYSKREQAADHLRYGGIVFDESTKIIKKTKLGISLEFNPTEATAYNISQETLADIISKLTDEQKAFADEMQDYLSTVMGAKGNEVSMEMYDIKLFKEKNYFPLKSAQQFMEKVREQQKGDVKIKNSGFSKGTVPHAKNPIVLTPFMDVWSNHVNEMSMYHAFVLPLEDFYRIYNYKTPSNNETLATEGVNQYIQNAYGRAATAYIDQLLKDLNGGARGDSTTGIINKMMGLFKKGAVFASLSVVVQQPSAIARAAALVDTKYFIGPKVDHKRHKALWEEVKQYAPVAIIKEMGYFDTNMGKSTQDFILGKEYSGFKDKMKALVTDSGYRDEVLSKAPALADELAWCSIWEAVKRETKAQYPGLDAKSEPFLMLAGSRFTEVITKTQVYDSVLSRSANMRSKDTGMKMATAFMAEPTTSINMIADALLQGKRGKKRYCRTAIGAVIASQIFNSILVSFVYAGRDDDEDKTYWEKYIGTLSGEIVDSLNPAGYIPFIKDIQSIVQGYDVERSDMAVISDLWNAWKKLGNDNLSVYRKVEGFAGSIAQIFGLPVKNIMRDVRGIYQTIESFMSGQQTTSAGIGYAVKSALPKWMGGGDTSNQNQLYEAYLSGDKTQIARVEGRYKDQSAINTAIRKGLRENDPRIKQAAEAKFNGKLSEYTRLAKEIIAEKHFSQDNVVAAINAEINLLDKDETTTSSSSKASGLYKADDFAVAISSGDSAMANAVRADIIRTAQQNGKSAEDAEKSFNSTAKSALKELFLEGNLSEQKAINALTTYCGIEETDAMADVQYWAFKQDYPDSYADDSWFDAYYEDVADSGIDIGVYMDYRSKVKSITGDNKKEGRMAVIDSLPITSEQKDALYFAEGWAASKLHEAPWH